ncbi:dTTP/UTP pyrophosphatase [Schistocerca serialis cubense]|uniref:dTTP/UTP pyrophosphatase n=1 Tax=Schistocerca serialis cubense TaxID=2023355 RepID=UPI00214EA910|nr:dTTP/UTP pyrophosphatase [Schistocerca serialis cubense]XP_049963938.1 dTTP/UTP pyrophosphatase [Schistocerca serialis cubense]XP_049963939.1 dTTP/UTP pyrophosphatase [Schistocerca serialis cubense]XP_049963940.1 dTTP/UTP pyrophosphatase [Schistocerca serialis cubense]XP_049963941.1 dTTP/UTP pyrophosphatase [Schistocerca serialis cubense]XP_049963942.1 dTTP/UTP pyrophosphatase [Schistocerca serialis cubense]XP_049963943.1 dTTP/UTP pyrophosphatase [Schistocerca serialis cubense]
MLEPIKHVLNSQRIVLASTSPRRQEILSSIGLNFEICGSRYEENLDPSQFPDPSHFVLETAYNKVMEVVDRLKTDSRPPDLIIGADTVVSLDGKIFGKPKTKENAFQTLEKLSGRPHTVYTGIILVKKDKVVKFCESTKVYFGHLTPEIISGYVKTGEPMDKAGGYGIQGLGGSLIEKIEGDYYTVMGLPLHSLCKHILSLYKDAEVS